MIKPLAAALLALSITGCKQADAAAPREVAPASVRLLPRQGDLATLITAEVAKAHARKLRPFLELRAEWCKPCKQLEASMNDSRMIAAFAGTYLISIDIDEWDGKLDAIGVAADSIPVFYELDAKGKPTGRNINGGAWDENIPANMAPPLKAFFAAR